MSTKNISAENTADREFVLTRVFNAPRELVWEAWTNPKHVTKWWGPRGFTSTTEVMDVRAGGEWKHAMRGPDGVNYPNHGFFKEVVKPERIVYSHGGHRENGPGVRFEATWTFEKVEGGKTKVTMRGVFPTAAERDFVVKEFGAIEGGKQTLEKLGEHLAGMQTEPFVLTRVFDAPRELLWKAWTEPERLMQWFGPKGFTTKTCRVDLRPGGIFHYCLQSPDGKEMWGKFVYREIVRPERLVVVSSFSDAAGGVTRHPMSPTWPQEMLTTTTFAEQDGKTTMTLRWTPLEASEEERKTFDGARGSMDQGWKGTLEQLTEYLAKAS